MTNGILNAILNDALSDMPVEDEESLAEWLCIAFMRLKDGEGHLIGGRIDPDHALQIAKMMVEAALVVFDPFEEQQND